MTIILRLFKNTIVRVLTIVILIVGLILSIAFWEKVVELYNHSIAYYYVYVGDKKYNQGDFQKAIDNYNTALKLYPEHVKARYNLGNIYVAYEDFHSAALCYEKAVKHYPNYINAHIHLGIILAEELFDLDRAIEEYQKAVKTTPNIIKVPYFFNNEPYITQSKAVAYYNLGLAYKSKSLIFSEEPKKERQYLKKAAESYKKSLELEPQSYETYYNLGTTLYLLGKYTDAKKAYCQAINIEPLNYELHYNLALLLREIKDYKGSITELEKAGLILDSKGNGLATSYIYDVLNEVSQKAVLQNKHNHLVEKIDKKPSSYSQITYVNGKVVPTEALDKAIIENMRKCKACEGLKIKTKKN